MMLDSLSTGFMYLIQEGWVTYHLIGGYLSIGRIGSEAPAHVKSTFILKEGANKQEVQLIVRSQPLQITLPKKVLH